VPGTGHGRFGGRERRLAAAQRAYGALPPAQRRALVLRYVDGLEPAAVADRLAVTEAEVDGLLAAGRAALVHRRPAVARPLGVAATLAALAITALPSAPHGATAPLAAAPPREGITYVDGDGPLPVPAAREAADAAAAAHRAVRAATVSGVTLTDDLTPRRPGGSACRSLCLPKTPKTGDTIRVALPTAVSETVGRRELTFEQEYVPLCEAVPSAPVDAASCVPGSA
jgi:hypothetical protein